MKIVLDTNVLLSGLLTPFGSSGEIVRMGFAGKLALCLDVRILSEYREVLFRPKFQFNKEHVNTLLRFISPNGIFPATIPLKDPLPGMDDEPFLEVAVGAAAKCLITGNTAHFPPSLRQGVTVLSPSEFIEFYRREMDMHEL